MGVCASTCLRAGVRGEGVVSSRGRGEGRGRGEAGFLAPCCGGWRGERGEGGGSRSRWAAPPARSPAAVAPATADMLPKLGGPALPLLLPSLLLLPLLLGAGGGRGARAEVLFRCPPCTAERLAACGPPPVASPAAGSLGAGGARAPCVELVREPGCGCCSVCARLEGEACGVYTPRCAQGMRCYPKPGSELPLHALVHGEGTCEKLGDADYGANREQVAGNAGRDHELGLTWRQRGGSAGGRCGGKVFGGTTGTAVEREEEALLRSGETVGSENAKVRPRVRAWK